MLKSRQDHLQSIRPGRFVKTTVAANHIQSINLSSPQDLYGRRLTGTVTERAFTVLLDGLRLRLLGTIPSATQGEEQA